MITVKEFYHVKKCSICQAFGYTAKNCKDIRPFCESCGKSHATHTYRNTQSCCINYTENNRLKGTQFNIHYKATDPNCRSYQRGIKSTRQQEIIEQQQSTANQNTSQDTTKQMYNSQKPPLLNFH
ncbi:hypothetical protein AVEN_80043-1 [Araneus ventricosus]|uniref:Uncharacterized protein n=1 Tax=Araneus ventricosus TaxID=182803 RepID=A0A4Y2PJJ5_ARAVE|nr:hypothetical protein AVEN_80043-1 [Araneus ventricosus]